LKNQDRLTMLMLDDINTLSDSTKDLVALATARSEEVTQSTASWEGGGKSSTISDPTANAALDPRRAKRKAQIKKARQEIKAARTALQTALSALTAATQH
tara:strand:+ start:8155 stop:8454 length:300 start_codon:yes stop_codon:yes gene_type:complete